MSSVDVLNPANTLYPKPMGYASPVDSASTDYGSGNGGQTGAGGSGQIPQWLIELIISLALMAQQYMQGQDNGLGSDDDDGSSGVDPTGGGGGGWPGVDPTGGGGGPGVDPTGGSPGAPTIDPSVDQAPAPTSTVAPPTDGPGQNGGTTPATQAPDTAGTGGVPTTSAGSGPNTIQITNSQDHAITVGKFKNGESTTDPSAQITLQPGQTGSIAYQNGEAGYMAQADSSGKFQSNASRLEYEADANGKMKYPDISYIDGRNASISLTDGAALNKGDNKSIAGSAPSDIVSQDAAGNKTITGWYDGSSGSMQQGGAYMASKLGTDGAYLHPNDDQLGAGSNPMSATQSNVLYATFGNA